MRKCLVLVLVVFSFLAVGCSDETDNEIREPIIVREDIVVDDVGVLQFQADKPLQERYLHVGFHMSLGMVVVGKISSKSKPGNNNTQWILD